MKDYLSQLTNLLDIFQLISTAWIVITNLLEVEGMLKENQRSIASLSVFLVWAKVFDWLRLFEGTSFYTKLVGETFKDIRNFMILFISSLSMCGFSLYVLQPNHS